MKALQINKFRGSLLFETKLPLPKPNQSNPILVRTKYSPINPSDLGWINGVYGNQAFKAKACFPLTLGFEGSGTVVDIHKDTVMKYPHINHLIGKSVFFYSEQGAWSDYTIIHPDNCIELDCRTEENFQQASTMYINPLTALAFIDIYERTKQTTKDIGILNTSGNSALGIIMSKLCSLLDIPLISISRSISTVTNNKNNIIINSTDKDYKQQLSEAIKEHNTRIAFDCLGGEQTATIFNSLPENSTLYHYGNFSMRPITGISTESLLFGNKVLKGFHLFSYLNSNEDYRKSVIEKFNKIYKEEKDLFFSCFCPKINKIYEIEDFEEAISEYKKNMSKGKCLFRF